MRAIFLFFLILATFNTFSQGVGINDDGSNPDASAILDVKSTDSGVLIPRLTTNQRTSIVSPATSLMVYDIDEKSFFFYDGSTWKKVGETSPLNKSWKYPQGVDGTLVTNYDPTVTYTVPSGKTLYITSLFGGVWDSNGNNINPTPEIIFSDFNDYDDSAFLPSLPVIPSGKNIKCACSGVLIDNSSEITPVIIYWANGTTNSYTVPNNKKFVFKSGLSGIRIFKINGYDVDFTSSAIETFIIPSNTTISTSVNNIERLFTGYLID